MQEKCICSPPAPPLAPGNSNGLHTEANPSGRSPSHQHPRKERGRHSQDCGCLGRKRPPEPKAFRSQGRRPRTRTEALDSSPAAVGQLPTAGAAAVTIAGRGGATKEERGIWYKDKQRQNKCRKIAN